MSTGSETSARPDCDRKQISYAPYAYVCDVCGQIGPDLELTLAALPEPAEMREQGWTVKDTPWDNGLDRCPRCTTAQPDPPTPEGTTRHD